MSGGWDHEKYFGSMVVSMFTLFQVMMFDNWCNGVVRHVLSNDPVTAVLFIVFICVGSFGLLNVVVGIIVNQVLQETRSAEAAKMEYEKSDQQKILEMLRDIFEQADDDKSGTLTMEEFEQAQKNPRLRDKMKAVNLTRS